MSGGGGGYLNCLATKEVLMTSTNVWMYRQGIRPDVTRDVVGFDVEATDGHIGKVDKASTDTSRDYLVVDTGFWIFGHKRLVPAGVISQIDYAGQHLFVAMTKDQIKSAPDYDEHMRPEDEAYYDKYASYYGRYGF
jgi:hypothetical protein